MEEMAFRDIKGVLPYFLKHKFLGTNYDDKADVLICSF